MSMHQPSPGMLVIQKCQQPPASQAPKEEFSLLPCWHTLLRKLPPQPAAWHPSQSWRPGPSRQGCPLARGMSRKFCVWLWAAQSMWARAPHHTQLAPPSLGHGGGSKNAAGCMGVRAPHPAAAPALRRGTAWAVGTASHGKLASGWMHECLKANRTGCQEGGSLLVIFAAGRPSTPLLAALSTPGKQRKWTNNLKLMDFWAKICSVI